MSWWDDDRAPGNREPMTADELEQQRAAAVVDAAVQNLLVMSGQEFTDGNIERARSAVLRELAGKSGPAPARPPAPPRRPAQAIAYKGGKTYYGDDAEIVRALAQREQLRLANARRAGGHPSARILMRMYELSPLQTAAMYREACRNEREPDWP